MGAVGFGFLAGILSILSPCVLPLLPVVLGSAAAAHRIGGLALAAGLALSFTGIGLFVATIGFAAGLDSDLFREIGAVLLAATGLVLLIEPLRLRLALVTGGLGSAGSRTMGTRAFGGLGGQFALGILLGAVWSPCVGPTIGAASLLAAQGRDLGRVAAIMLAFGLGTAAPLLLLGRLSRHAMISWKARMARAGRTGTHLLGFAAVAVGVLILTGLDHRLEAALVTLSPAWLTDLATRY